MLRHFSLFFKRLGKLTRECPGRAERFYGPCGRAATRRVTCNIGRSFNHTIVNLQPAPRWTVNREAGAGLLRKLLEYE